MWYFTGDSFFNNSKFAIIGIGVNINSSPIIKKYPTTYINLFCKKKLQF